MSEVGANNDQPFSRARSFRTAPGSRYSETVRRPDRELPISPDIGSYPARHSFGARGAPTPAPQDVSNGQRPIPIISKPLAWPRFEGLPARLHTATASFPKKRDQAKVLLPHLGGKSILKPAKPPGDRLHHLCSAGRAAFPRLHWPCFDISAEMSKQGQ